MDKYNTIGSRFVALILDLIVVIPVSVFIQLFTPPFAENLKFSFLFDQFAAVFSIFYYILMNFRYGQTLGKMAMKVKILDGNEQPITFAQAVIRSLPEMFSVFVAVGLVNIATRENPHHDVVQIIGIILNVVIWGWHIADIIVCFASDKKPALHDLIAGTVVVKTNV